MIAWLGPSTGAYLMMLMAAEQQQTFFQLWIVREYANFIYLEAAALAVILATGLSMRLLSPELRQARWLKAKLSVVFLVFIPFQIAQHYIYTFIMSEALITGKGIKEALSVYGQFNSVSTIAFSIAVPVVFFLAVFKPALGKGG